MWVFCQSLSKDKGTQAVEVAEDHDALDKLLHAPGIARLIRLNKSLQVIRGNCPGFERHDFVQLTKASQPRLNLH